MHLMRKLYVVLLLSKTLVKTLVRQLRLKLTKFTRRSHGPRSFVRKFIAGCQFVRSMAAYDCHVIRCCGQCVKKLHATKISAVLVYGEEDIIEVLHDWCLETSMTMSILREGYEDGKNFGRKTSPVEWAASMKEKIIVASLVNIDARVGRLRDLGVHHDRIVQLL